MNNSNCQPCALKFYCTAGNGMEYFLLQEVKTKLAAQDVDHIPGKVFFTTTFGVEHVRELKSAERLFLLLKRYVPLSPRTAMTAPEIHSRLMGDGSDWTRAVLSWKQLQRELTRSDQTASMVLAGRKRKRKEEEEGAVEGSPPDKPNVTPKRALVGESQEIGLRKDHLSSTEDCESGNCVGGDTAEVDDIDCDRDGGLQSDAGGRFSHQAPPVSFRVSCRCSGALSRRFTPQDVSRILGTAASRQLGWRVDLRRPDLEVNVYISDDHCVLGIPLLSLPLANRSYMKITGLRSTVAWAMASLSDVKPGSRVLDPMCGVGTILLEAAHEYQDAFFMGMDIDESQLFKACQNVEFAKLRDQMQLLQASCKDIPLPSSSVDAIVCDVPFGKKFGSKTDMVASLPVIVNEMERVLRVGGTLVLLLSPQLSCLLKKIITLQPVPSHTQEEDPGLGGGMDLFQSLQPQSYHRVSLGAIDAIIHKPL
uniref:THUMP domain-containing protein n=1 Tax=Esox lucius TaxID=8010 RepID=A0A3P8ZFE2_ESOLU